MAAEYGMANDRTELPTEFAEHAAAVSLLNDPPETLEEWWRAVAEQFSEGDLSVGPADLYSDEPTRHEIRVNDRTRYAYCALDALAGAVMEESTPVTVRSDDPVSDAPVTMTLDDRGVALSPDTAVICFGFDLTPRDVEAVGSIADWALQEDKGIVQSGVCQYTNAFENESTYEQWAAESDSVSAAFPPANVVRLLEDLPLDSR